ncbi:MAG: hypothetical protein RLY43_1089 [Bacteroidota bacterium]
MILYYGIRPTGSNLHLGHAMCLFNMFDFIKENISDIDTIYFLMAEIHAEISTLSQETILLNSILLKNKIIALLKTYCTFNSLNFDFIFSRIRFIFQNCNIGLYHRSLAYKYLTLENVNSLTTNPIFANSENNSVAFLVYPILQAFDVFLYCKDNMQMVVFVAGDQRANINIMKDIATKIKFKNDISYNVYDNVIYDSKCQVKMSKSLNNFIDFDNINDITKYILSYITYPRPTISTPGHYESCQFYNNILNPLMKSLDVIDKFAKNMNRCTNGDIGCVECKNAVLSQIIKFVTLYKKNQNEIFDITMINYDAIIPMYHRIIKQINVARSNVK